MGLHAPDPPCSTRIPDQTVLFWLKNPIYYGELLWEKFCTGIVNDVRVLQPNSADEMLRIPDFCQPLVSREVWEAVALLRRDRSERGRLNHPKNKKAKSKRLEPLGPRLALHYLLSGLLRCAHCNRSMVVSSGHYRAKAGPRHEYVRYGCTGSVYRACPNNTRVPEAWLRETVANLVMERLFDG